VNIGYAEGVGDSISRVFTECMTDLPLERINEEHYEMEMVECRMKAVQCEHPLESNNIRAVATHPLFAYPHAFLTLPP